MLIKYTIVSEERESFQKCSPLHYRDPEEKSKKAPGESGRWYELESIVGKKKEETVEAGPSRIMSPQYNDTWM